MVDEYKRYHGKRLEHRQMDELIGLAQGIIADGRVSQSEAEYLQGWLAKNLDIQSNPLLETIYDRVEDMLCDNILDDEEAAELLKVLQDFSAGEFETGEVQKSTTLPLCDPQPDIIVPERLFCFTGTFHVGNRKVCRKAIIDRGGLVGNITKKLHYLVIGEYATESWLHSSFGNKIIKAADYREQGTGLSILSERHWATSLGI